MHFIACEVNFSFLKKEQCYFYFFLIYSSICLYLYVIIYHSSDLCIFVEKKKQMGRSGNPMNYSHEKSWYFNITLMHSTANPI